MPDIRNPMESMMSLKPMRILPVPEETARVARAACPVRPQCTRTRNGAARALSFRPRAEHEAMQEVRRQQETAPWRRRYARRAGIEGTISQAVRRFRLRRCRYIGLARTGLQHILTAAALNVARVDAWFTGHPVAETRVHNFAALQPRPVRLTPPL